MNPYAQAGWSSSSNPHPTNNSTWGISPLYGALPYSTSPSTAPDFMAFTFSPLDGTILNSVVVGPHSRTYFRIDTDSTASGLSVIQNPKLESVTLIEWRRKPILEIRDIRPRCLTSQFLSLSPDKTQRLMSARRRTFRWTPSSGYIELYSTGVAAPQLFGRISQGRDNVTLLELTSEAIQLGLLEVCVTATLLLMSGRNID
ncbi:hypothetical protein C8R43DRAFT_1148143 [Mycena crocata]|nr:hypothetical protein C8R43DRAFT_1148143 [Mycena crocata]